MDANLEWWANSSFMLGPFPVVVEDVRNGRLRDVAHLEELRQTHDLDPAFTEAGFVNTQSTSSTGGNGSRLFERDDGWEVRYQCVLGAWTLELKPPHGTYVSFSRIRVKATEPCWHQEMPELITMMTPP